MSEETLYPWETSEPFEIGQTITFTNFGELTGTWIVRDIKPITDTVSTVYLGGAITSDNADSIK